MKKLLLGWIVGLSTPTVVDFMMGLSRVGQDWMFYGVTAIACLLMVAASRHKTRSRKIIKN
jgi:hypothetical protein